MPEFDAPDLDPLGRCKAWRNSIDGNHLSDFPVDDNNRLVLEHPFFHCAFSRNRLNDSVGLPCDFPQLSRGFADQLPAIFLVFGLALFNLGGDIPAFAVGLGIREMHLSICVSASVDGLCGNEGG